MGESAWPLQSDNVNAVVVVAHPDDETIFCGGMILTFPNWNWKIRTLTYPRHQNVTYGRMRYQQLEKAIEAYQSAGVKNITQQSLNFWDDNKKKVEEYSNIELEEIKGALKISLNGYVPGIVFTHNSAGEYGHEQHKLLNKIVCDLFDNVWEFTCPDDIGGIPQPFGAEIRMIPLTQQILDDKTRIFNASYISELYIWENLPEIMQYEFRIGPEIFTSGNL